MKVIILLLLFVGFLASFRKLQNLDEMRERWMRTTKEMNAASRQRTLAERQSILRLQENNSLWYAVEKVLMYSGLSVKYPRFTAEWWVLLNLAAGAAVWIGGLVFFGAVPALFGVTGLYLAEYMVIGILRRRALRQTEQNLTKLLDFLGNYSITTGEITGIFDQVSRYMEEPIKSALEACYYEASTTGDSSAALLMMAERLEHPKFKELARNLEISIRYCADLSALVNGSRRSLREYLHSVQQRRGLMREGFINLALLLGMSVLVLLSIGKLTGMEMKSLLLEDWPGRIGLGLLGLIFVIFLSKMKQFE